MENLPNKTVSNALKYLIENNFNPKLKVVDGFVEHIEFISHGFLVFSIDHKNKIKEILGLLFNEFFYEHSTQYIYLKKFPYSTILQDKKPIDNVTTKNLQRLLFSVGININYVVIDKIIDLVELLENKGDSVSLKDISILESKWENHEI